MFQDKGLSWKETRCSERNIFLYKTNNTSSQLHRMSEYWVSRKTWTCKYCNLTINDDVPSRLQHENGMRHKGNVERALKDVYRKSENDRREKRNLEIEMKKINRVSLSRT